MRASAPLPISNAPTETPSSAAAPSTVSRFYWEGLDEWRARTRGDADLCIAVLDGPVDLQHPVFIGSRVREVRLPDSGFRPAALGVDHATHVASILFGDPALGVPGLAPGCRGVMIPIFDETAEGGLSPCSQDRLAAAIDLAIACGAHIINISAGQLSVDGRANESLMAAVRRASEHALIVAAAGNDGCDCLHVPGALPDVLAVGAMDTLGNPLPFSNWGEKYREQGLLAPGEGILGGVAGGAVTGRSGTSFAAPLVAGVAALASSLARQRGMRLSSHELRELLLSSATAVAGGTDADPRALAGRLDLTLLLQHVERLGEPSVKSLSNHEPAYAKAASTGHGVTASDANSPQVAPSAGCGCGCGGKQLAYVIGQLGYDFESDARRDSIQQAMSSPVAVPHEPVVESPYDLLRHLRGYSEIRLETKCGRIEEIKRDPGTGFVKIKTTADSPVIDAADEGRQLALFGLTERFFPTGAFKSSVLNANLGAKTRIRDVDAANRTFLLDRCPMSLLRAFNLKCATWVLPTAHRVTTPHPARSYDAPAVSWTLHRGQITLYVVRPTGSFSESAYQELTSFLMNHHGWSQAALNLYYYECCDETHVWGAPWDPRFNDSHFAEGNFTHNLATPFSEYAPVLTVPVTERVAFPGVVRGQANLRACVTAPVLHPELRGAAEWSAKRLFEGIQAEVSESAPVLSDTLERKIKDLLARLDEDVRNPGLTPQHRALNFASTQQSELLKLVRADLEGDFEVDTVRPPVPSNQCRPGSDCWDVEVSFFNPANVQESPILVRQSVDVSDVVPVLTDRPRRFRRR